MIFPLVGGAYKSRFPGWDGQRLVNMYVEAGSSGSKTPAMLVGTPGLKPFATLNALGGEVRGMKSANDHLYAVCGNTLHKITAAGVVSTVGTLETSTGPVDIEDNGLELYVGDNPSGYVLNYSTGVFGKITDADWPGAAVASYIDGYVVLIIPETGRFAITGLYAGGSIDALDVASAEGSPDDLVSVLVDHREVWLFGERTTEVWFNSGAADFPLERVSGGFLEIGCQAARSVAKLDNSVFWLTDQGTICRAAGYAPQIVSTRAVEYQISTYANRSNARAFSYHQHGHAFYVLTFDESTWVYDAATGEWHERQSYGMTRWRANCHEAFAGLQLVGDLFSGKVYSLDDNTFDEDGAILPAIRVTPPVAAEAARVFMSELQVDFQAGVGLNTGQGSDPQAILAWSDDGGNTWSNEHWRPIGRMGQYTARAIWRRLGSFRNRMFRLTITDPVRRCIVGAYAKIEKGAH